MKMKKFDSKFEKEVYALLNKVEGFKYHPQQTIKYTVSRTYEPDFVYKTRKKTVWVEVKGRFRTSDEARKYVCISEALGPKEELVFLFQKPRTPMPGSRRRKDGTRYTMAEWADKKGFRWYSLETVPILWSEGWER
jgi:hypothetical protein